MKLSIITAPSVEPVTLAEAKSHARMYADLTDDDAMITSLITAAREWLENRLARAFITQTLEDTRFNVAGGSTIRLLRAPVQSIVSVKVDGVTLDPSAYMLDVGSPGWLGFTSPSALNDSTVVVQYAAGYGDDATAVPEVAKLIVKIMVAHWYARREPIVTGTIVAELPFVVEALCDGLRWGSEVPR